MFVHINFVANCSNPPAVDGMITEPYNDTAEGAIVYFHCTSQYGVPISSEKVCQDNGKWSAQLQSKII